MMNNGTGVHRRWRRRAATVIGLGIVTVAAVAVPAFAHPSFPSGGAGFAPNPNGGTGAGTQPPPYAPGSANTLNLRVPFERDGVIYQGALNTTVDIKAIVPAGMDRPGLRGGEHLGRRLPAGHPGSRLDLRCRDRQ